MMNNKDGKKLGACNAPNSDKIEYYFFDFLELREYIKPDKKIPAYAVMIRDYFFHVIVSSLLFMGLLYLLLFYLDAEYFFDWCYLIAFVIPLNNAMTICLTKEEMSRDLFNEYFSKSDYKLSPLKWYEKILLSVACFVSTCLIFAACLAIFQFYS